MKDLFASTSTQVVLFRGPDGIRRQVTRTRMRVEDGHDDASAALRCDPNHVNHRGSVLTNKT